MKNKLKYMDKFLLALMFVYTILGLVMIFSASSPTAVLYSQVAEYYFFKKQFFVVVLCWILGFFLILKMPTTIYKKLGPLGIICIIITLFLLFPYGTITNSAKSWFYIGKFNFQPSEVAKSILIVFMAVYYELLIKKKDYRMDKLIIPAISALIICGLVALQPDLGTGAIIAGIAFFIFIALPIKDYKYKKLKTMSKITAVLLFSAIIIFGFSLNEEQQSRLNFKSPCVRYTEKTGYQVCNGFIAINNGGLFGTGLGNSTQKYLYLPEAYTDFIFPVIVEELGVIAGIVIIIGFILMLYRILTIARNASTTRGSIIAYGTFIMILLHLLVNFLGILALIPLTGVPVPFLSYGGSFYINLMFMLFLTQKVHMETIKDHNKAMIRSV